MRLGRFLLAIGLLAGGLQPVLAQGARENPTGSRVGRVKPADISDSSNLSAADRGRAALYEFGDCIVSDSPTRAKRFLEAKADSPEATELLGKLGTNFCLRVGQITIPLTFLRGAVFRTAYMTTFRNDPAGPAETPVDYQAMLVDPSQGAGLQHLVMMDFASCVVRQDFKNSAKLVRAGVATSAEKEALQALTPYMGPCLAAGAQVTLTKTSIASMLAEALYHEAMAAQAASGTAN